MTGTWATANPDGLYHRTIVGINNQWPLPMVEVGKGDQLLVNVFNSLGNKITSIHWHIIFQIKLEHITWTVLHSDPMAFAVFSIGLCRLLFLKGPIRMAVACKSLPDTRGN